MSIPRLIALGLLLSAAIVARLVEGSGGQMAMLFAGVAAGYAVNRDIKPGNGGGA